MRATRGGRVLVAVAMLVGAAVAPLAGPAPALAVTNPAGYVNTLIGTSNSGETFPGADTPYGMVQWSPENTAGNQTRTVRPGGYGYNATRIRGFSLTHMSGTGCAGGSGDIPFMPHVGTVATSPSADTTDATYASDFSHADETATAGYYRVRLNSGVNAELTATTRTGSGRFTYPTGSTASMLVRTSNSEVGSSAAQVTIDAAEPHHQRLGDQRQLLRLHQRRRPAQLLHAALHRGVRPAVHHRGHLAGRHAATRHDDRVAAAPTYGTDGWPVAGKGSGGYVTFDLSRAPPSACGSASRTSARPTPRPTSRPRTRPGRPSTRCASAPPTPGTPSSAASTSPAAAPTQLTDVLHRALPRPAAPERLQRRQRPVHRHGPAGAHGGERPAAQYANFSGWDVYRGAGPAGDAAHARTSARTSPSRCSTRPTRTAASGTAGPTTRAARTS